VLEDAGIEPRTVATLALAVRRSYHSARSHLYTCPGYRTIPGSVHTDIWFTSLKLSFVAGRLSLVYIWIVYFSLNPHSRNLIII
jgi:hypothetical protein